MKPLSVFFFCILVSASAGAEDVTLTINGTTNNVTLGKESVITLPDGATLKVLVASKPYALYSDKLFSFEYPAEHKPEISKDSHGDTTITFISSSGANVIIHEHGSPTESLVDMLLKEVTKNDIASGYSSVERKIVKSVNGGTFSGKEITTAGHKKEKIHRVLECRRKDVNLVITVFFYREDATQAEKFLEHFWSTMKVKNEANPPGGANGRQPVSPDTNSASAAAASHRSP